MMKQEITIQIPEGLEARPVALLVQVASQYGSEFYVESDNKKVNAKSIMGMMTLGLFAGETVTVSADGEDEEEAIAVLVFCPEICYDETDHTVWKIRQLKELQQRWTRIQALRRFTICLWTRFPMRNGAGGSQRY